MAFATLATRDYDLVISSSHALAKMVGRGARGVHLSYCYSPPRYLWDLHDVYMAQADWKRRAAMTVGRGFLQALDKASARRVTHFVGISRCVADRISRVYGRTARVIYPPVEAKAGNGRASSGNREGFLLYLGRLVPYKRVDLIVRAATRHGIRTVIAGDGPERARLKALAGRNVEFVGAVTEAQAGDLLDRCAAFLFCAEDDFGIAPLEANAHGAPVVALRAGATLETMRDGETAILFDDPTDEALAAAVKRALQHPWDESILRSNAARFGPERFREIQPPPVRDEIHVGAGRALEIAAHLEQDREHTEALEHHPLLADGLEPHKVAQLWLAAPGQPNTVVDIGDTLELKCKALLAHPSQLGKDVVDVAGELARWMAEGQDFEFGESFRRFILESEPE